MQSQAKYISRVGLVTVMVIAGSDLEKRQPWDEWAQLLWNVN
jgi:hypothetical protein